MRDRDEQSEEAEPERERVQRHERPRRRCRRRASSVRLREHAVRGRATYGGGAGSLRPARSATGRSASGESQYVHGGCDVGARRARPARRSACTSSAAATTNVAEPRRVREREADGQRQRQRLHAAAPRASPNQPPNGAKRSRRVSERGQLRHVSRQSACICTRRQIARFIEADRRAAGDERARERHVLAARGAHDRERAAVRAAARASRESIARSPARRRRASLRGRAGRSDRSSVASIAGCTIACSGPASNWRVATLSAATLRCCACATIAAKSPAAGRTSASIVAIHCAAGCGRAQTDVEPPRFAVPAGRNRRRVDDAHARIARRRCARTQAIVSSREPPSTTRISPTSGPAASRPCRHGAMRAASSSTGTITLTHAGAAARRARARCGSRECPGPYGRR